MMPDLFSELGGLGRGLVTLISIALGLLTCFAGYRLFRLLLAVYGFVLGAVVGLAMASGLTGGETLWVIAGALIGGLTGAVLLVLLFFVGIFVIGAAGGALLANLVGGGLAWDVPALVTVLAAVAGGVLALFLQRFGIVAFTALNGAWAVVGGVAALFTGRALELSVMLGRLDAWEGADLPYLVGLIAWLGLALIGAAVQLATTSHEET
jgi:hypothetical protein